VEFAASALAKQSAYSHTKQNLVRKLGGVEKLVSVLKTYPGEKLAEKASLSLANLCLNNQANRDALRKAGGFATLLAVLQVASYFRCNNNNKYAYAGHLNSFTHLRARLVLHDRGNNTFCCRNHEIVVQPTVMLVFKCQQI
jgi:hypothetical protein